MVGMPHPTHCYTPKFWNLFGAKPPEQHNGCLPAAPSVQHTLDLGHDDIAGCHGFQPEGDMTSQHVRNVVLPTYVGNIWEVVYVCVYKLRVCVCAWRWVGVCVCLCVHMYVYINTCAMYIYIYRYDVYR